MSSGLMGGQCESGEFGGFGDGVPVVGSGEESFREELPGFFLCELAGPRYAGREIGARHSARAGVAELCEPRGLFVGGVIPVVPALGTDRCGEFGVEEDGTRKRAPGAAEVDTGTMRVRGRIRVTGSDSAVEDDVARALIGGGAGLRGDVAGAVGVNLRMIEDGGGVAEDEVDGALDVRVDVVLAAVVGEERV